MNSIAFDSIINSSFIDTLTLCIQNLSTYITESVVALQQKESVFAAVESLPDSLHFDEFQWTLLKGFTLVLIIKLLLIFIAWRFCGKNICERFMKPPTSKAIEELRASVSRLKLPKEHSPRI